MAEKKRNNLNVYKRATASTPVLKEELQRGGEHVPTAVAHQKTKSLGRPKKDPKQKRDQKITLNLTKEEKDKVAAKAGLVPESTFILNVLRETNLFE